ncbi:LAXTG-anchored chaplin ChpB [Streptomyces chumphonensis]|uniref:Chaplin n=1 Tax=Streptomyces chumphonensis TaxID=1214925 RepID=A0A927EZD0_9ACTN|nr:chaplin [Streptomyces chumphonensis]MBD3931537.1 chaplin [Streptomyces chumphonensis]
MRQVTRKGLITVVAASGALAMSGGAAFADADAEGAAVGSPGVLSGNNVQAPVHVPVNACGNTVSVVGLLNPAMGNTCVNDGGHHDDGGHHQDDAKPGGHHGGGHQEDGHGGGHHGGHQGGSHSGGGATAEGAAVGSPGVASGNNVQAPVDVPVNACGNSVNVVGLLNPAMGNECVNDSGHPEHPEHPEPEVPEEEKPEEPEEEQPEEPQEEQPPSDTPDVSTPQEDRPNEPRAQLAETGGPSALTTVVPAGVTMLLGGYVLYRRARVGQN